MSKLTTLPKTFLHLAALVLLFNATVGYGACCLTTAPQSFANDVVVSESKVKHQAEQSLPPCHRTSGNNVSVVVNQVENQTDSSVSTWPEESQNEISLSADTCCLMCIAMAPALEFSQNADCPQATPRIGSASTLLSANIDPLLRPPIS